MELLNDFVSEGNQQRKVVASKKTVQAVEYLLFKYSAIEQHNKNLDEQLKG